MAQWPKWIAITPGYADQRKVALRSLMGLRAETEACLGIRLWTEEPTFELLLQRSPLQPPGIWRVEGNPA